MTERPPLLLSEWTRETGSAHAADTMLVLPIGSLEQHGPHLPAGTDAILVEHVARAAAERVRDELPVVVAPTVPYGCSHHHLPFGVTGSLRSETYLAVLGDLLTSFEESGFRHVFLLNGHGGNHEVAHLAIRDKGLERTMDLAVASYYELVEATAVSAGVHRIGEVPGHAGAFETSLMLAIQPELVRPELPVRSLPAEFDGRRPGGPRYVGRGRFRGGDGFSDSPAGADRLLGKTLLEGGVEAVAAAMRAFSDRVRTAG